MKWINAEQQVTVTIYDEEHEEYLDRTMSVEEMLDTYTNEGCPTIYSNPEQTRWIPVEERLPEEYKRVLVSDSWCGVYVGQYVDAQENWGGEHFINEAGMHSKTVVAWMPLPKPYKAESEDKECI